MRISSAARVISIFLVWATSLSVCAAEASSSGRANAVVANFGLISLPLDHQLRVSVVDAGACPSPQPVRVRVHDAHGLVLLDQRGVVGKNQPLLVELARNGAALTSPALVSTEVTVGPKAPLNAPPCLMNVTVQTVTGDTSAGPVQSCVVDPCLVPPVGGSPGDLVAGRRCLPGPTQGIKTQAMCVIRLVFAPPDN